MKTHLPSTLLLIYFLLSGCQPSSGSKFPPLPDIGVGLEELNKDVDISLRKNRNTFTIGDNIVVDLRLRSDSHIDSDFEVSVFILNTQSNQWDIVSSFDNEMPSTTFLNEENIILNPQNPSFVLVLRPEIDTQSNDAVLLIMIKGKKILLPGQGDEFIGSYTIVNLKK